MAPKTYRFGEFQLEEERRRLLRNGEPVGLSSRSFDLLVCLVKNAGKLMSRDELFTTVWGENSNTNDEVLTDALSKLRSALGDDERPYKIIETIHRKGYQFIAPIEAGGSIEENASIEAESDRSTPFEVWHGESGIKWVFVVIVLATVGLSIFFAQGSNDATLYASLSHLVLVLVSLLYFHLFLHVKEFRSFPADLDTKDSLKDPVKKATKHEEVHEWSETRENAKDALGYITTCWQVLLVIWLALYGLLAYMACLNLENGHPLKQTLTPEWVNILKQAITIANNNNTLMLLLCFSAFNRLEKIRKGSKWNLKDKKWLLGIIVIVLLAIVEAVCVNKYSQIGQRIGRNDLRVEDILWFFRVVSGISGAIAMALFVGRLQSKFFNPPAKLIGVLYAYTAIQPLFVFFDDESKSMPFITALVIHTALILKCFLFLYLFWTFKTGRLLFYLVRVRLTNKEIENEWDYFQTVLEQEDTKEK